MKKSNHVSYSSPHLIQYCLKSFMSTVLNANVCAVCMCLDRPVNYVLSWLSVVGPLVGLDVPLKYSTDLLPAAALGSTKPD